MQITLRNIPPPLDQALRQRARKQGKGVEEVVVEALLTALGLVEQPVKQRDLADIAGSWQEDPEFEGALADQRRIDPGLWL